LMSFAKTWLNHDRASEGGANNTDTDGENRLYGSEIGREEEASVIIKARRLLVKVGGLENRGDERHVEIDLPSGGRRESGGAHERDEIDIGVALEQFDRGAVSGGGLSTL